MSMAIFSSSVTFFFILKLTSWRSIAANNNDSKRKFQISDVVYVNGPAYSCKQREMRRRRVETVQGKTQSEFTIFFCFVLYLAIYNEYGNRMENEGISMRTRLGRARKEGKSKKKDCLRQILTPIVKRSISVRVLNFHFPARPTKDNFVFICWVSLRHLHLSYG